MCLRNNILLSALPRRYAVRNENAFIIWRRQKRRFRGAVERLRRYRACQRGVVTFDGRQQKGDGVTGDMQRVSDAWAAWRCACLPLPCLY